jgi:hypothetical protein
MGIIEGALGRNTKQTVVSGAAAGNVTVTGVTSSDRLVSVVNVTDGTDLTAEFSITGANTINNTGGTATTSKKLLVQYVKAA